MVTAPGASQSETDPTWICDKSEVGHVNSTASTRLKARGRAVAIGAVSVGLAVAGAFGPAAGAAFAEGKQAPAKPGHAPKPPKAPKTQVQPAGPDPASGAIDGPQASGPEVRI